MSPHSKVCVPNASSLNTKDVSLLWWAAGDGSKAAIVHRNRPTTKSVGSDVVLLDGRAERNSPGRLSGSL